MIERDAAGTVCRIQRNLIPGIAAQLQQPQVILLGHNVRLDNQLDLVEALGLPHDSRPAHIIARAWARWGPACADRLRGAFSFAIVAPNDPAIHLVRDIFGLSPLFYMVDRDHITIAANSAILRSTLGSPVSDNIRMLADFISGTLIERERTYFENVMRVPAAHILTIGPDGVRKDQYWSLSDVPRNVEPPDPPELFRQLFDASTANCIAPGQTTLMLSGGLDSSAIAGAWRAIDPDGSPFPSFALTYRETDKWSDGVHLAAVAAKTGCALTEAPSDQHDPLSDMEFWLAATEGPYHGVGHSVSTRLLKFAREAGFEVVLCGHGGDEIVSYGFGRLNELATARKWLSLWRESRGSAGLYGRRRSLIFARYLTHYEALRPMFRYIYSKFNEERVIDAGFLHPDLERDLPKDRYTVRPASNRLDHTERMLQEEVLGMALQPASLEVYSLCSQAVGVETRMPFYDRELLEMSLALPSRWKLHGGLSRYILREAMRDRLPSATLRRRDKFDFCGAFIAGLVANRSKVLDLTAADSPLVKTIANPRRLQAARQQLTQNGTDISVTDAFFLWRVAILRMWADVSRRPLAQTQLETNGKVL